VIDFVEGVMARTGAGYAVIDVGGVGLRALVPASTAAHLPAAGERTKLFTYLHVREDALTLYGFASTAELEVFGLLLGVSGLGPAKALALLSASSVSTLRGDIARENTAALIRIPGVGRKLAAQIILDLKDKIGPIVDEEGHDGQGGRDGGDVIAYLMAMGMSAAQAQQAVAKLPRDPSMALEDRIRQALGVLRSD
jgi:Holliday junction DNA helicase RuvA